MKDTRAALAALIESPHFDAAYERAIAAPECPTWLTASYLAELNDVFGVLPTTYDDAVIALSEVTKDPFLVLYAKVIYHILETKERYAQAFPALRTPDAPNGASCTLGYDCVLLFPVLGHIKPSAEILAARGVTPDVITASLLWTNNFFAECTKKAGKPCYTTRYFAAYSAGIYVQTLIIGRLRFEIAPNAEKPMRVFRHTDGTLLALADGARIHASGQILGSYGAEDETDAYDADLCETETFFEGYRIDQATALVTRERVRLNKSEWAQVFVSGDTTVKVHIPVGGPLTPALCEESYARARAMLPLWYPEHHFTCFLIGCWMLSPVLEEILPPTSNILTFARPFLRHPIKSSALDAFLYVFGIHASSPAKIALADLPEDGTLKRGVKQKALEGKFIHQVGGYLPF